MTACARMVVPELLVVTLFLASGCATANVVDGVPRTVHKLADDQFEVRFGYEGRWSELNLFLDWKGRTASIWISDEDMPCSITGVTFSRLSLEDEEAGALTAEAQKSLAFDPKNLRFAFARKESRSRDPSGNWDDDPSTASLPTAILVIGEGTDWVLLTRSASGWKKRAVVKWRFEPGRTWAGVLVAAAAPPVFVGALLVDVVTSPVQLMVKAVMENSGHDCSEWRSFPWTRF